MIKTLTISFRFYLGGNETQILYSQVDKMPLLKTQIRVLKVEETVIIFGLGKKDKNIEAGFEGQVRFGDVRVCTEIIRRKGF